MHPRWLFTQQRITLIPNRVVAEIPTTFTKKEINLHSKLKPPLFHSK